MSNHHTAGGLAAAACLSFATSASALPRDGVYADLPTCDDHGELVIIEELGNGPIFEANFADELISAGSTMTQLSACPGTDDPSVPNVLVRMTNLTTRSFSNLFYVGDAAEDFGLPPETGLSNVDGFADDLTMPSSAGPGLAFKIDDVGLNRPLVSESVAPDLVFTPGETWEFIIDDYANVFGLPPEALGSPGFASLSTGTGTTASSGSIVVVIPEPTVAAGLLAATPMLLRRRRA